MTNDELIMLILLVINKAPTWVRHDLMATESAVRMRAEEALAAMIGANIAVAPVEQATPHRDAA